MVSGNNPVDLAVIQVNFERPVDTIECIHSVERSDFQPIRIILVDNGSRDASAELFKREFPQQEIIRLPENRLFTGGHNAGIQAALESGATHIFILNNDTTLDQETITRLVEAMERNRWDIVVPKIVLYDDPSTVWSAGARYRAFPPAVVMIGLRKPDAPRFNRAGVLQYATGCAFLARRKVFETLGGFDDLFGAYNEDYDFFYRAGRAGFKTGYAPQARVLHKVSRTAGRYPARQRFFLARNAVLFFRKDHRFSKPTLWAHMAWIFVREALKGRWAELKDYWRGYREGFRILEQTQIR